jgi:hypothetical protein
MGDSIQLPTKIRVMNGAEYGIVSRVFGSTLPYKFRIWITNAAGKDGRGFTIPTSLVATILSIPVTGFFGGVIGGYVGSALNLAYLINVGDEYDKLSGNNQRLLVHETTHVWQGKNSTFSQSYVYNSIINQHLKGQGAYTYTAGQDWSSYNVEQQASIVEDWFSQGENKSNNLFPYIRDYVRQGKHKMCVKFSFIKNTLAILSLCLFLFGCSPVTKASGSVTDKNGNPIESAKIEIKGKSVKNNFFLTKTDGLYDFGEVEIVSHENPIEITLTVSKSEYKTFSKELRFGEDNKDTVVLETENN